jgi:ABC-type polysaccharide/polyol phosphate export permease
MLGREVFASEGMHWINLMNPMYPLLMMFREPLFESAVWTYEQVSGVAAWTAAFWTVAIILAASNGRRLVFSL